MRSDTKIVDSVMRDFCYRTSDILFLIKYAVMKKYGAGLDSSRIDFPDQSDPDEYFHFEGVKIVKFDTISDWEEVVLVSQKEFLEICLYYVSEFKKSHPEEKDPLILLAEEKLQKDLAAMPSQTLSKSLAAGNLPQRKLSLFKRLVLKLSKVF